MHVSYNIPPIKTFLGCAKFVSFGFFNSVIMKRFNEEVFVGHDCIIGRSCIICANASVGASTSLGDDIVLGHRAAVKDHLSIVAKTRIAAKSGVVRDITEEGDYAGHPAVKAMEFKQQVKTLPIKSSHRHRTDGTNHQNLSWISKTFLMSHKKIFWAKHLRLIFLFLFGSGKP